MKKTSLGRDFWWVGRFALDVASVGELFGRYKAQVRDPWSLHSRLGQVWCFLQVSLLFYGVLLFFSGMFYYVLLFFLYVKSI